GLEVVLADGRILNALSKLKKDNTGYDLRNLFIGAEGTLGIITAATLKLFPKPHAVETAFVGVKSPAAALKLLSISENEAAGTLTSFELLSDIAVDFSVRHGIDIRNPLVSKHPWYVLMELSSSAMTPAPRWNRSWRRAWSRPSSMTPQLRRILPSVWRS